MKIRGDQDIRAVPSADLVLRGGTVATVDPEIGNMEAIAISGAKQLLEREIDPATHKQLLDKLASEL